MLSVSQQLHCTQRFSEAQATALVVIVSRVRGANDSCGGCTPHRVVRLRREAAPATRRPDDVSRARDYEPERDLRGEVQVERFSRGNRKHGQKVCAHRSEAIAVVAYGGVVALHPTVSARNADAFSGLRRTVHRVLSGLAVIAQEGHLT